MTIDSYYLNNALFLSVYYLSLPNLAFRANLPALSSYYGLINYGPYELPPRPKKTIAILYPDDNSFEHIATKIKDALEKGFKGYFPGGFAKIFDVDIDFVTAKIDSSRYNMLEPEVTAEEYYNKYAEICKDQDDCFPVLLINKVPRGLYKSLYTEVKYKFTDEGIPSQVATYEVFSDEDLFKWSIFPLALQIFVKMGGTPFLLHDRLNIPEDEVAMIIGVGLSKIHLQAEEARYIGFATAFEANGQWRLIRWSPHPYNKNELPTMLKTLISDVIDDVLSRYTIKKPSKIHAIVHYSGKNISVAEECAMKDACYEIKQIQNINVIPYIVKIQESMYRLYDEESPCYDSNNNPTYLVRVGTTIKLKENLYLLNTTGCIAVQTGKGDIIFRPNTHGSPSPLIVSIKRLKGIEYELDDIELVKSVLYMARMNYGSINNPISRLPISTKYSRVLAHMAARFMYKLGGGSGDINSLIKDRIKRTLWFI